AGDPVDDALRLLQHIGDDAFGGAHLQQVVAWILSPPPGQLEAAPCWCERAREAVRHQLSVSFPPGSTPIALGNAVAVGLEAVCVDPAECADTAGERPIPGRDAVRDRDALAAFDQRQHLYASHADRIDQLHGPSPPRPCDTTVTAVVSGCKVN